MLSWTLGSRRELEKRGKVGFSVLPQQVRVGEGWRWDWSVRLLLGSTKSKWVNENTWRLPPLLKGGLRGGGRIHNRSKSV